MTTTAIGQDVKAYRGADECPTVAEYVAAGLDEKSAAELRLADVRASQTRAWLVDHGFRLSRPRSAKQEAQRYAQGWRPYLATRKGTIQLSVLGLWAKHRS